MGKETIVGAVDERACLLLYGAPDTTVRRDDDRWSRFAVESSFEQQPVQV